MNKEQTKLFELLREFDAFCKENDIKYCLSGETLLYGVTMGCIEPWPTHGVVIMTGDNCSKFVSCFEKKHPQNREIEYWGNSPKYPDYTVRYVASDTTSFNIVEFLNYNTHGMYIEIMILRGENHKKETLSKLALERGIMINSFSEATQKTEINGKKDILSNGYYKTATVFAGKKKIRKQLFDYFTTKCIKPVAPEKGKSGIYTVFFKGKKYRDISRNYFDQPETCEIEGYTFPVPRNARTYLRRFFGERIKCSYAGDQVTDSFAFADFCVVDVDTPYAESIKNMNLTDDDFIKIYKSKERIDEINELNKDNNKRAKTDWQTVLQTGARFRMWKKYMPMKEEILKLNADLNGDDKEKAREALKALDKIFADYKAELENMKPLKRSFSFDNELFDAFISMMEHQGHFKEADRIIRDLPMSHLKDIEMEIEK
ncbi:MAG: LicD family protein [Mogibacterium sp.]|nr:LicD family protein [Mogibacterium sp.]